MYKPRVFLAPLPEGVLGYTDGETSIWLDDQLLDVDRDIVLQHELIHFYRGHRGHCLTVTEYGIDREIASSRIHLDALGEAAAWSEHLWSIAEELDVSPETVETRAHALTPRERELLTTRLADAHWA